MLEILIPSVLSATIQAVLGKGLEHALEKSARRARRRLEELPVERAAEAVRGAVEAARREMVSEYWPGEDALSKDVVAFLDRPKVVDEVTERLVFRGQPDFARLRRAYFENETGDETEISERWRALQGPLEVFIDLIEDHLEADPHLGPLLRDTRRLSSLSRLEGTNQLIAERSREIQAATERSADLLENLLAVTRTGEAHLGQIPNLLSQILEAVGTSHPTEPTADLDPAEKSYLRLLRERCDRLPLADDPRAVDAKPEHRASLANVYVDLETTTAPRKAVIFDRLGVPGEEREKLARKAVRAGGEGGREAIPEEALEAGQLFHFGGEKLDDKHPLRPWAADEETLKTALGPLTALEALARHQQLVLLGDPGSGKSTFVNRLAMTLTDRLLGEEQEPPATPGGPFEERLFPVRIVLRRWSARVGDGEPGEGEELELFYRALDELRGGVPRERWLERFADPSTLVLFDGLDEVPTAESTEGDGEEELDRRQLLLAAVEAFRTAHPECRVAVTCRVKPYREGGYQLAEIPTFELAPLDDPRIASFCERWYQELIRLRRLTPAEAEERRERLLRALGERWVLREMAGTPLLLTMLARVNARRPLPDSRAELYGECVEQLLWEWEREKGDSGGVGSLVTLLEEPAKGRSGKPIPRAAVERVLWRLTYAAHGRSGKDGTAELAADQLREGLAKIHPEEHPGWAWASRVLGLLRERGGLLIATDDEVFTFPHRSFQEYLAARWLVEQENRAATARQLVAADAWHEVILLSCGYLGSQGRVGDLQAIVQELVAGGTPEDAEGWIRILLAGRAWREFGPHRAEGATGEELAEKIPPLLTALMQHLDLPAAQRLEAGLLAADLGDLPADLDAWVEIPADQLEYPFRVGKYPVTNAQFQRFVDAGGYDRENGWFSDEAQREIEKFWSGWPTGPRLQDNPEFNRPTQPVVGVSYYEAAAYAAWLTAELRRTEEIGEDQEVRLPTVAEWQRVAAGTEGREYPWSSDFDSRRANSKESKLGQSTPVHMYPAGATPEGIFDLSGNVWEWTADLDEDGWGRLVGGAYWNDAEGVNTAARLVDHRVNWGDFIGFRVVVVPISRS